MWWALASRAWRGRGGGAACLVETDEAVVVLVIGSEIGCVPPLVVAGYHALRCPFWLVRVFTLLSMAEGNKLWKAESQVLVSISVVKFLYHDFVSHMHFYFVLFILIFVLIKVLIIVIVIVIVRVIFTSILCLTGFVTNTTVWRIGNHGIEQVVIRFHASIYLIFGSR
jgi:hypothetical protein